MACEFAVLPGQRLTSYTNGVQGASTATKDPTLKSKKDEPPQELTPLEKMLQNAGPVRSDGSDKFFGLENVRCEPFLTCALDAS